MAALDRCGAPSLGLPLMDRAREEFIDLLALVDQADNAQLPSAWRDLVECAAESFAREDVWMRATGYALRKDLTETRAKAANRLRRKCPSCVSSPRDPERWSQAFKPVQ